MTARHYGSRASLVLGLSLLASVSAIGAADEQGFVRVTSEEIQWRDVPNGQGVQVATSQGDPTKPGIYVQRVKFPPHIMDHPHFHPDERHITVLKGTWYTGTGESFDLAKAVPLRAGSYMMHPAKGVHWDGAAKDEEVIVQVIGYGPSGTALANPQEPFWVDVK
jgi:quercetin dioxygenase-like cupin family protein